MSAMFLVNLVLAAAFGALVGGQLGTGIGVGSAVLFGLALHFAPGMIKKFSAWSPNLTPLPVQPEKPPFLLAGLPPLPKLALPSCVHTFLAGIGPFFASFLSERVLPFTIGNIVLVLLAAGLVLGVQVALYTALIAVPVVLITLMLLAVYSGPSEG